MSATDMPADNATPEPHEWNTDAEFEAKTTLLPSGYTQHVENRIRAAFPDINPSGGHDLIDELIGLLRVTRGQRDNNEKESLILRASLSKASALLLNSAIPFCTPEEFSGIKHELEMCKRDKEEIEHFLYRVTLHLQQNRSKTPEQDDAMFQEAYRLYVKYNADRFDPGYSNRMAAIQADALLSNREKAK